MNLILFPFKRGLKTNQINDADTCFTPPPANTPKALHPFCDSSAGGWPLRGAIMSTKLDKRVSDKTEGKQKSVCNRSRNKLAEGFLNDALEAWKTYGKEALAVMAAEKPSDFVKMIAQVIPREDKLDHSLSNDLAVWMADRTKLDNTG